MNFEFNDISKKKQAVLISALLAAVFGVLGSFFGEIFLAPTAALMSALFLFESEEKRVFSFIVPALIAIVNIFIGGLYSVLGVAPLILALIIYFMYRKGRSKGECVVVLTVASAILILISLYFAAANMTASFDFESVKGFYLEMYDGIKADFVNQMSQISNVNPGIQEPIFTEEELLLLFDSIAGQLISVLVIVSFVISGIALKLFCAIIYRFEKEPHIVVGWRFRVTNVFAYFYGLLIFLNLFAGAGLGIAELVIINLNNIFTVVFAYFGFLVARDLLSRGRSRGFATAMLLVGIFLLSALALQILSVVGLFFTIADNKRNAIKKDN